MVLTNLESDDDVKETEVFPATVSNLNSRILALSTPCSAQDYVMRLESIQLVYGFDTVTINNLIKRYPHVETTE